MTQKIALQTLIADCLKLKHAIKKHESLVQQANDQYDELSKRLIAYLNLEEKRQVLINIEGKPFLVALIGRGYSRQLHITALSDLETLEGTEEFNYLAEEEQEDENTNFESFFGDLSTISDLKIKETFGETHDLLKQLAKNTEK